jgi:hypothetical protein
MDKLYASESTPYGPCGAKPMSCESINGRTFRRIALSAQKRQQERKCRNRKMHPFFPCEAVVDVDGKYLKCNVTTKRHASTNNVDEEYGNIDRRKMARSTFATNTSQGVPQGTNMNASKNTQQTRPTSNNDKRPRPTSNSTQQNTPISNSTQQTRLRSNLTRPRPTSNSTQQNTPISNRTQRTRLRSNLTRPRASTENIRGNNNNNTNGNGNENTNGNGNVGSNMTNNSNRTNNNSNSNRPNNNMNSNIPNNNINSNIPNNIINSNMTTTNSNSNRTNNNINSNMTTNATRNSNIAEKENTYIVNKSNETNGRNIKDFSKMILFWDSQSKNRSSAQRQVTSNQRKGDATNLEPYDKNNFILGKVQDTNNSVDNAFVSSVTEYLSYTRVLDIFDGMSVQDIQQNNDISKKQTPEQMYIFSEKYKLCINIWDFDVQSWVTMGTKLNCNHQVYLYYFEDRFGFLINKEQIDAMRDNPFNVGGSTSKRKTVGNPGNTNVGNVKRKRTENANVEITKRKRNANVEGEPNAKRRTGENEVEVEIHKRKRNANVEGEPNAKRRTGENKVEVEIHKRKRNANVEGEPNAKRRTTNVEITNVEMENVDNTRKRKRNDNAAHQQTDVKKQNTKNVVKQKRKRNEENSVDISNARVNKRKM